MGSFNKKKKFSEVLAKESTGKYVRPEDSKMYKRLMDRAHSGVYIADERGLIFYVNDALVRMLGYSSQKEILERSLIEVLYGSPEAGFEFYDAMEELGFINDYEIANKKADGYEIVLSVTSHFIREGAGKVKGVEGIVYDRTETKKIEKSLTKEKQKLEEILNLGDKVTTIREFQELIDFVVDRIAVILEARVCSILLVDENSGTLKIAGAFGLDKEIIEKTEISVGDPIAGVVAKDLIPILVKNIEYDERFKRANREGYTNQSFMIVPILVGDELLGVIDVADKISDVSIGASFDEIDLKILASLARETAVAIDNLKVITDLNLQTVTDPLTRIYNYRKFSDSLEHEIKRLGRTKGNLCVMMLDLDNFKSYNDSFGHLEGDTLLRGIGEILRKNLRDTDIVCRYAGDEFVIVLPDTNIEGLKESATKVIREVSAHPFKRQVTVSLGAARYQEGMTSNELMLKADKSLYEAKEKGKNQFYILE